MPRVLQGLPGDLQEQAVLRIEQLGLAVAQAEEERIEPLDAFG
jgi:hypothetical protein